MQHSLSLYDSELERRASYISYCDVAVHILLSNVGSEDACLSEKVQNLHSHYPQIGSHHHLHNKNCTCSYLHTKS